VHKFYLGRFEYRKLKAMKSDLMPESVKIVGGCLLCSVLGANPVVWDGGPSQDTPILPILPAATQNKAFSWSHMGGEDDTTKIRF
jgi:hypothetical protein